MAVQANPFLPFLEAKGYVLLDGGLATTLEGMGHRLETALWSARLLLDDPEAIREAHAAFLRAGSDVVTTATYQATVEGLQRAAGLIAQPAALLRRAVALACGARDAYEAERTAGDTRPRPLVAASIGPYGAFLADGSEYVGRYGLDRAALVRFHGERFRLLAEAGADLLACETIPALVEVEALVELLAEAPDAWAWISVSCRDGAHLSDGTRVEEVAAVTRGSERVAALGINCTAPEHVPSLIERLRRVTDLPLLAYPNSGEHYDAETKQWHGPPAGPAWVDTVARLREAGALVLGGCCRVGPDAIRLLAARLAASSPSA